MGDSVEARISPMKPKPGDFVLTCRPERGHPAPFVALRRLLKRLLRSYGMRCIAVEQVEKRTRPQPSPECEEPAC
jgi:hypothetical protein